MGPSAWAMTSRWRRRRGPKASRSHTPPPKSAPPNRTYALSESASIAARMSESCTSGTSHLPRGIDASPFCRLGASDNLAVQQPRYDHAKEAIEKREEDERDDEPRDRRNRVSCSKHSIDDPRLASY